MVSFLRPPQRSRLFSSCAMWGIVSCRPFALWKTDVSSDKMGSNSMIWQKISKGLANVITVFSYLFLLVVVMLSFFGTEFQDGVSREELINVNMLSGGLQSLAWFLGVAVCVLLLVSLVILRRSLEKLNEKTLLCIVISVTFLLGLVWIRSQAAVDTLYPDSHQVSTYAASAVNGDWSSFTESAGISDPAQLPSDAHFYFMAVPYQSGLFYFFYVTYLLFGAGNVVAVQVINLFACEAMLLCAYAIGRIFLPTRGSRNTLLILLGLCFPLIMSCSFIYGNSVGYAFGFIFLLLQIKALTSNETKDVVKLSVISFPFLALGLMIKSTIVLLAIAVAIAWVVKALVLRNLTGLLACILVIALSNSASAIPERLLEQQTSLDFGRGMPTSSWIEIGLTTSPLLANEPGWWDATAMNEFRTSHGDYNAQNESAKEGIVRAVNGFIEDPGFACWFFLRKLSTEWSDPTFQTVYFSQLNLNSNGDMFRPFFGKTVGNPLYWIMDGCQLLAYIGAFAFLAFDRRRSIASIALIATFFTGFGCYLLWEAKGIYLLPYYVLLLPFAAGGLCSIVNRIGQKEYRNVEHLGMERIALSE